MSFTNRLTGQVSPRFVFTTALEEQPAPLDAKAVHPRAGPHGRSDWLIILSRSAGKIYCRCLIVALSVSISHQPSICFSLLFVSPQAYRSSCPSPNAVRLADRRPGRAAACMPCSGVLADDPVAVRQLHPPFLLPALPSRGQVSCQDGSLVMMYSESNSTPTYSSIRTP